MENKWKVEETCGSLVESGRHVDNGVWPQHPSRIVKDWGERVLGVERRTKEEGMMKERNRVVTENQEQWKNGDRNE